MSIILYLLIPFLGKTMIQILLTVPIGAIVYFLILFIFKTFTEGEKKLIYEIYSDLKSNLFH